MATAQQAGSVSFIVLLSVLIPVVLGLAIIFALAYIPANIAKKKGYGFAGFYLFGLFFFLIALIVSLCLSDKKQQLDDFKKAIRTEDFSPSAADELKNDL